MRQDEELAELETGDDGASAELGHVVLVPAADALDETVDAQAFELSGNLTGGEAREPVLDVDVPEARDHVLGRTKSLSAFFDIRGASPLKSASV